MFWRSPGFTLAVIAALAIGIGTNAAIFSIVNTVLLQPLHAPEADRIVAFSADAMGSRAFASDIKFNLWLAQTSVFELQSAYRTNTLDLTGIETPQKVKAIFVTGNYFQLFGLPIAKGRGFLADEERPNGPRVALLSDKLWRNTWGANPSILAQTILLGGEAYQIIGIVSPAARTETIQPPDVWLPFPIDPNSTAQVHYFQAVGRLKQGISVQMANSQLQVTTREFWRKYPDSVSTRRGDVLAVRRLQDVLIHDVRSSLVALWGRWVWCS